MTPHALWWAGHAVLAGPVLAGAAAVSLLGAAVRRLDPAVGRRLPSTEASTWRGLGLSSAVVPTLVLLGFAAVFTAISLARFRWEET